MVGGFRVPGSNLLRAATRLIAQQDIEVRAANGRTLNAVGQYVSTYDPNNALKASVQPLPRSVYKQFGLDFKKTAWQIYIQVAIEDLARDGSPDHLIYNGNRLEVVTQREWHVADGWTNIIAYEVPLDIPDTPS